MHERKTAVTKGKLLILNALTMYHGSLSGEVK